MTAVFLFERRGNSGAEKPWQDGCQARDQLIVLQPRKLAYIISRQIRGVARQISLGHVPVWGGGGCTPVKLQA